MFLTSQSTAAGVKSGERCFVMRRLQGRNTRCKRIRARLQARNSHGHGSSFEIRAKRWFDGKESSNRTEAPLRCRGRNVSRH